MRIREVLEELSRVIQRRVNTVEDLLLFSESIEVAANQLSIDEIELSLVLRKCLVIIDSYLAGMCEDNEERVDKTELAFRIKRTYF